MTDKPNVYPKGSTEFVTIVLVDAGSGTPQYSVNPIGTRPTSWTNLEGGSGFTLTGLLDVGTYRVFVKLTSGSNHPIIDCGLFEIV